MTHRVELLWLFPACLMACAPVAMEPAGTRMVGAASALALPEPGSQEIVAVVERRYANALEQEIAFATEASTPGQNSLRVRFLGLARAKGDDVLVPTAMTDETIAAELRTAFPGVALQPSHLYAQNSYGPFGYATGSGRGRDLCFYGWQRIAGEVTTPFVRQGAIDVRLRLCRAGASERSLVSAMYGYTVRAPFGRNWSAGAPVPVTNAAIGATGVSIYPVSPPLAEAPTRPAVSARSPRPPAAPQPITPPPASAAASTRASVGAPMVPGPGPIVATVPVPPVPTLGLAAADVPIVPPPPVPVVLPDLANGPAG